jgi:transposase
MWIPPEQRDPIVFHHPTRESMGYYGAVRLRDGKFIWRQERDKFCGDSFLVFLKDVYRVALRSGRKVVLVADNARYHHAKSLKPWLSKVSKHLIIEFLPSYSPELNPTERIWKLARRKATHNCYFSSLDDLSLSVEHIFNLWRKGNETLRKLCAIY